MCGVGPDNPMVRIVTVTPFFPSKMFTCSFRLPARSLAVVKRGDKGCMTTDNRDVFRGEDSQLWCILQ